MAHQFEILRLKGEAIIPYIPALAKLRIEIFKEYPYLYLGNLQYETKYLQTYVQCPESIIVIVLDRSEVVGASTAIPLEFETAEYQKPFLDHGMNIKDIFYFGESVLLPAYRGKKIYRHFFENRESAARDYGSEITTFCAIERSNDDPRRPKDYTPLDKVWEYFGYQKHPELCAYLEWKEVGDEAMTTKPLMFWLKTL